MLSPPNRRIPRVLPIDANGRFCLIVAPGAGGGLYDQTDPAWGGVTMPHRGGVEHVEQRQGFAAFSSSVTDGRPSCVRRGAARKGLAVSDGNKRVCPTPEVNEARRKRPAPSRECTQGDGGGVTASRPLATPETFVRRGASAPALTLCAPTEEPIDLTNTSSGSEEDATDATRGDLLSEVTRLRAQLKEEQKAKRSKQKLVDEGALEVGELVGVVESLKKQLAAAKAQVVQVQAQSAASITDLERRLDDAAVARTALVGAFAEGDGSGPGRKLLQTYVQHLADRLAEVISIAVPNDTSLSTIEGTVASAERLAIDLANLIVEQRAKADSAAREATEERKAREQADAALVRAGQAAEATVSAHLAAQVSHLESENNRQIWEMQQAMAATKGTTSYIAGDCRATVDCL